MGQEAQGGEDCGQNASEIGGGEFTDRISDNRGEEWRHRRQGRQGETFGGQDKWNRGGEGTLGTPERGVERQPRAHELL